MKKSSLVLKDSGLWLAALVSVASCFQVLEANASSFKGAAEKPLLLEQRAKINYDRHPWPW